MRITQSVNVLAGAEDVWPFIADPALQAEWNPQFVSIDRRHSGPAILGERFAMTRSRDGERQVFDVEVVEVNILTRIVFRHRMIWKNREQIFDEIYDVDVGAGGTRVTQTTDLSRSGLPWWVRLIVWFTVRNDQHVEESYLEKLKRRIEKRQAAV